MTGLHRIIETIEHDGALACERVALAADTTCREIAEQAQTVAQDKIARIEADTQAQADTARVLAHSGADLQYRRQILAAKGAMINAVVDKAKQAFCTMEDRAYFDILVTLIVRYAEPGEATLVLNDRDLARVPDGFLDRINRMLKTGCRITAIVGGCPDSSGGFQLCYQQTVQNCTVTALFDEYDDEIQDVLSHLLFS